MIKISSVLEKSIKNENEIRFGEKISNIIPSNAVGDAPAVISGPANANCAWTSELFPNSCVVCSNPL